MATKLLAEYGIYTFDHVCPRYILKYCHPKVIIGQCKHTEEYLKKAQFQLFEV